MRRSPVQRYVDAADKAKLAEQAIAKLRGGRRDAVQWLKKGL
jgi:hypothetical protein